MQTLGISDSTPRSESRIKSLFWPSITSATDVDYLGAQGYWVCTFIAAFSLGFLLLAGQLIMAFAMASFYYLGGVGVRERSRYAAAIMTAVCFLNVIISLGIVEIIFCALLISNLRGTWIASAWQPGSEQSELPPRMGETWSDKFVDRFPMWLWPKIRIVYYIFSVGFLALIVAGLALSARGY